MTETILDRKRASQRQFDLIKDLLKEREISAPLNDHVVSARHFAMSGSLSWEGAHQLINALLAAPKLTSVPAPTPAEPRVSVAVAPGRYALETEGHVDFYHVSKTGYVQVQAGDALYPLRNQRQRATVLVRIASDPSAASRRYGRELEHCGVCGRTLTDTNSRAEGIGPVCAAKTGW